MEEQNNLTYLQMTILNIKEWEANGGIGIHHTSVNKTISKLKKLGFA